MASVDVIIPCYNYAHLLPECVDSVLGQGCDEARIVIIDNASTDDSVGVARQLAQGCAQIELVCHETNLGSHASFNEGLARATADYTLILCADDLLAPGSLRTALDLLERHPETSCAIGAYDGPVVGNERRNAPVRPEEASLVAGEAFVDCCCRTVGLEVAAHALLVRTTVQRAAGAYRASIPQLDDLEMSLRLARQGTVVQLGAPLAIRRLHGANVSSAIWHDRLMDLRERKAVFDSFFREEGRDMPNARGLHALARRRLGAWAYWSALSHLTRGEREAGRDLLRFARENNPRCVVLPPVGHLLRTEGSFDRLATVLGERLRRRP